MAITLVELQGHFVEAPGPGRRRKFAYGDPFYAKKVYRILMVEIRQSIIVVHGGEGDD